MEVEYPSLGEYVFAKENAVTKSSPYYKKIIKDNKYEVCGVSDDKIYLSDKYQNYFFIDCFEYKDYFISTKDLRSSKLDKILD